MTYIVLLFINLTVQYLALVLSSRDTLPKRFEWWCILHRWSGLQRGEVSGVGPTPTSTTTASITTASITTASASASQLHSPDM